MLLLCRSENYLARLVLCTQLHSWLFCWELSFQSWPICWKLRKIFKIKTNSVSFPVDLMVWTACFFNRGLLSWIHEKWVIPEFSVGKTMMFVKNIVKTHYAAVQTEFEKNVFWRVFEWKSRDSFEFLKLKISSNWLTKNILICQRKNSWNWCATNLHQIFKMN